MDIKFCQFGEGQNWDWIEQK